MTDHSSDRKISAEWVLLPDGWHQHVEIRFDESGLISELLPSNGINSHHVLIPGMINVHSHAFQRGLVGKTQRFSRPEDDFWSWRTHMYSAVGKLSPDKQRTDSKNLFDEFIRNGYTTVCEFHYTHGAVERGNAEIPALTCEALLEAASDSGIRMLLLPVLYQQGGFGQRPASSDQRSFLLNTDVYLALIDHLRSESGISNLQRIGYAPHSLRAVTEDALRDLLDHRRDNAPDSPIHIHISEQIREINECVLATRKRPVEWLLDSCDVDQNWCLIHATHITSAELEGIVKSGATVGLCPTTEADLGDGVFPMVEFLDSAGNWAIGSDSNVCVNPCEEIRLIDYHQRLINRRRNVFHIDTALGSGTRLYLDACEGGRRACGMPVGRIESGSHADMIALRSDTDMTQGLSADEMLNAYIYAGGRDLIEEVFVAGNPRF